MHRYFDTAKQADCRPPYEPPAFPEQTEPAHARRSTDTHARTPGLLLRLGHPARSHAGSLRARARRHLLGDGESSRLYQKLVRDQGTVQSIGIWANGQRGPDWLALRAVLSDRGKLPAVQKTIAAEIDRLGAEGPTAAELEKSKTRLASDFVFGLESNMHRANELAQFELYWGDARLLSRELSHYRAVTASQVRDAVKKYLVKARRSTVHVLPPGPDADKILKFRRVRYAAVRDARVESGAVLRAVYRPCGVLRVTPRARRAPQRPFRRRPRRRAPRPRRRAPRTPRRLPGCRPTGSSRQSMTTR